MSNRLSPSPILLQSPNHSAKDSLKLFPRSDILPNTSNSDCVCSCLASLSSQTLGMKSSIRVWSSMILWNHTWVTSRYAAPCFSRTLTSCLLWATEQCRWSPSTPHPSPGKTPAILLTLAQETLLAWGWVSKPPDKVVSPSYAYLLI